MNISSSNQVITPYATVDFVDKRYGNRQWDVACYPHTDNCQLCVIGSACSIITNKGITKDEKKQMFRLLTQRWNRSLLLMDIRSEVAQIAREIFSNPGSIVMDSPYKSTNGSNMVIMIVNTNV